MQQVIRIRGIKAEAAKYRVTLKELCRRSGQPYSTVNRWEKGEAMPRLDKYESVTTALDNEIAVIKREMYEAMGVFRSPELARADDALEGDSV